MSLPQPDRIVVVNDISVARGGATALALRSALELRARGHEVTFLTGDNGGNAELEAAGIEIVGVGQERLLASSPAKALINGLYNGAAARIVDDWIARRDTPATVYHLHGWAQMGLVAATALLVAGGVISTRLGEPDEPATYESVVSSAPDVITTRTALMTASDKLEQRDAALQYVLSY